MCVFFELCFGYDFSVVCVYCDVVVVDLVCCVSVCVYMVGEYVVFG